MLTQDDLQAISNLIKSEIEPIKQRQEQIAREVLTKRDLELSNQVMGTIFKVELRSFGQEILEAMKIGFKEMIREFKQNEAEQDERIEILEKGFETVKLHNN